VSPTTVLRLAWKSTQERMSGRIYDVSKENIKRLTLEKKRDCIKNSSRNSASKYQLLDHFAVDIIHRST
jgi:hypothetical protein